MSSYIIEPNIINEEGTEEKLLFPISIIYKDSTTDLNTYLDNLTKEVKSYTDTKISDLINGAPTTLDTLKEIADAIETSSSTIEVLNEAIGKKADKSDVESLTTLVNSKASNDDLQTLTAAVNKNSTRIESLEGGEVHIEDATESTKGIMKLYSSTGINEDGSITQKLFSSNLETINSSLENLSNNKMDNISFTDNGLLKYTTDGIVLDKSSYADKTKYGDNFISVNRKEETTIGEASIAFGTSNMVAEGTGSVALGNSSIATGLTAVAMGYQVEASGSNSVALGSATKSTGDNSFSMGANAKATNEFAIALGNSSVSNGTFSIANGAFVVTQGLASLYMGTGSTVMPDSLSSESDILTSYNSNKFALSKGNYSIGFGLDNLILSHYSIGIGSSNVVKNIGSDSLTSYVYTLGTDNTTSGTFSLIVGNTNTVSSNYSEVLGYKNNVTGNGLVVGKNNTVSGDYNICLGLNNTTSGSTGLTVGENLTNTKSNLGKTVIGVYNNEKQDTLLEIGNGTSESKKNILEVTNTGVIRTGTGGTFSKLSDDYTTSSGTAEQGIGASSLSVYNLYNHIEERINNIGIFTDDTTGTKYTIGVDNGKLYIKEVN